MSSSLSAEVIVVDNASSDLSAETAHSFPVPKKYAKVKLIASSTNLGFGKANNLAAAAAKGNYLLFLNSDALIRAGALRQMHQFLNQQPTVGIASCQLLNPDKTIQPQGGYLPRLSTVAIWAFFIDDLPAIQQIIPSYQLRRQSFFIGRPREIGWVGGTAMWVRRDAWMQLGGFDEKIFMYGEDVELCLRARRLGWKVMVNPQAHVVHLGSASGNGINWIAGEVKALRYLFLKHKPAWEMPLIRLILRFGMGLRWLFFGILGGNEQLKKGYAQAFRTA